MVKLMKNLGIADDNDDDDNNYMDHSKNIDRIHNNYRIGSSDNSVRKIKDNYNEFSIFVNVYKNCKIYRINPDIIFSWIKDLFDCYFPSDFLTFIIIDKQTIIYEEKEAISPNSYLDISSTY
jgi:hypothetical protein